MKWKKMGRVFCPAGEGGWMNSHAQGPTLLILEDRLRIYFSSRVRRNLSLMSYVDVEKGNPSHLMAVNKVPLLEIGEVGAFDEHGTTPSCVVVEDNKVLLYYNGWSRGEGVAYRIAVGVAVSYDNGMTFQRLYSGPILDRSPMEPYMAMAPYVLRMGGIWKMWYASGTGWVVEGDKYNPIYQIKYAESDDGIHWRRDGRTCITPCTDQEAATRPTVMLDSNGKYHMWFCYREGKEYYQRGRGYRIGYACSEDGISWERNDTEAGINLSEAGWDSEMMSYPYYVNVEGRDLLFFNGNDFGGTGFGYAVLHA